MATVEDVFALVEAYPDLAETLGGVPEHLIQAAEEELGVTFPTSYRLFLSHYGYLAFGSEEIKGLSPLGVRGTATDVAWSTLERRKLGMPSGLVEVVDPGIGDWVYCLDTDTIDGRGECPVVRWIPEGGPQSVQPETAFAAFPDLVLARLQMELEE